MACPSEMWVLGMPGMSQIRLRCVRESLCTAGVWPLRDPLAVMQVVCHLGIAGPRKPSDLHCPSTWGARWLAWWFWTGALAERTRKPPRCVAAVQNSTKEKGWGWQLWLLCCNAQSIQITEYLWSEQSIGMTCGAGGYLAHRSICKTPLKVLSKALVKLGKSKMLGDVGSRISPGVLNSWVKRYSNISKCSVSSISETDSGKIIWIKHHVGSFWIIESTSTKSIGPPGSHR
jgi:hypothetical protein